jgi:hypothetical protein
MSSRASGGLVQLCYLGLPYLVSDPVRAPMENVFVVKISHWIGT